MSGHADYYGYSKNMDGTLTVYTTVGSKYSPSALVFTPVVDRPESGFNWDDEEDCDDDEENEQTLDWDISLRDGTKVGELCVTL
jgi:hypothetical protein